MSRTVSMAFDKFRENIEVSTYNREIATKRKDGLVSLLERHFEILDAFPSGSLPRYTAVKGHADLDIIVVLHFNKHIEGRLPSEVLGSIQKALSHYVTSVRRNGQAVTLSYETWPSVDIVPVARVTNKDGSIHSYDVPDMNSEKWITSRPRKHSNKMSDKNKQNEKFKRFVKMVKWWNHQNQSLLQSYHIEVLSLELFDEDAGEYPWALSKFFDEARGMISNDFWYEDSYVGDYLSYTDKQEVLKKMSHANSLALSAWYAGYNGEDKEAIDYWRQIFGKEFPSYYT